MTKKVVFVFTVNPRAVYHGTVELLRVMDHVEN